ncbi:hypothetical protein BCR35DRAFT_270464 [Leucosporidium creatinivorum]|uniref:Uncharacterized protein n=1 Tax=Leucosporidium creatinivorum TaxID=106004 RepID=A0A1Y2DZF1_9BASI|nr:hypothetical protein BCR35DRAFT_270464 [Leucosporidium creatinivorum]
MDNYTPSVSPIPPAARAAYQAQQQNHKRTTTLDELEDLGIGNSKSRKPGFDSIDEQAGEGEDGATTPTDPYAPKPKAQPAKQEPPKPELKTSQSKSWLGGWFKREASPVNNGPGPVKAKLGEETSFVYDADLKKWVMKVSLSDSSPSNSR